MRGRSKTTFGIIFVIALFANAIFFASYIQENEQVKELISSFGHFGILFVAFISGLNLFIPIPATAFIPIFSAAGFNLIMIISILVIGTTMADLVGFYIGTVLKPHLDKRENKIYTFIKKWCEGRPVMTQIIVFLWAALVPFPNEAILLPLGTLGVKLRTISISFLIGNVVHITIAGFSLTSLI